MQARRAAEREKLLKLKEDLAKSGQVSGLAVGGDNAGDKKEKKGLLRKLSFKRRGSKTKQQEPGGAAGAGDGGDVALEDLSA